LWRANRKRLSSEAIRDGMLLISRQLDLGQPGSPVKGLGTLVTQNTADQQEFRTSESMHRSMYLPIIRGELPTMLVAFDFADPDLVVGRRAVTNVPAQSLLLLNSEFVVGCAEATAAHLDQGANVADDALVSVIYLRVLSREPTCDETQRAVRFLAAARRDLASPDGAKRTPLGQLIQTLFASTYYRMVD
jgi:hypothetical protein